MRTLIFLIHYLRSYIRAALFELSPTHFHKFYLSRQMKYIKRNISFYSTINKFSDIQIISKPDYIKRFKDLNRFNLDYKDCLQKGLVQESSRVFHSENQGYTIGLSSGTSGTRGIFLTTDNEQLKWVAYMFSKLSWFSIFKSYKIAFFLRNNNPMYEKINRSKKIQFNFFDLVKPLEELKQNLVKFNPTILIAPPYILEKFLQDKKKDKDFIKSVEIIISVADVLDKELEEELRATFKCPIHQIYQATEGFLATTCSHENLHLNEDAILFETKFIDKEKRRWKPIVTDLMRESQAIIKYELNDILIDSKQTCPCGSKKRYINAIEGRSDEVLEFKEHSIYPDYVRNAIQNELIEPLDFCVIKENSSQTIKILIEGQIVKERDLKIKKNIQALLSLELQNEWNIVVEGHFHRDLTQKRKRVFNK